MRRINIILNYIKVAPSRHKNRVKVERITPFLCSIIERFSHMGVVNITHIIWQFVLLLRSFIEHSSWGMVYILVIYP